MGKPMDKPMGKPMDKPMGKPMDKPMGKLRKTVKSSVKIISVYAINSFKELYERHEHIAPLFTATHWLCSNNELGREPVHRDLKLCDCGNFEIDNHNDYDVPRTHTIKMKIYDIDIIVLVDPVPWEDLIEATFYVDNKPVAFLNGIKDINSIDDSPTGSKIKEHQGEIVHLLYCMFFDCQVHKKNLKDRKCDEYDSNTNIPHECLEAEALFNEAIKEWEKRKRGKLGPYNYPAGSSRTWIFRILWSIYDDR